MVTVSTVIPTYNRAELLTRRALASVLAQTVDDWECIVVGDGTDDDTVAAMAEFKDPRVRFINRPRPEYPANPLLRWRIAGAAAFNAGLDLARGRWVSYLADDDCYLPRHHELLLGAAGDADVVYGLSMGAALNVYGGHEVPDPFDIVQGAYLMRRTAAGRAQTTPGAESWDALWWREILGRGLRFNRVRELVHEYHPAPETAAFHGSGTW